MLKWILQDVVRTLKSRKVLFILVVVLASILMLVIPNRLKVPEEKGYRVFVEDKVTEIHHFLIRDIMFLDEQNRLRLDLDCLGLNSDNPGCEAEKEYTQNFDHLAYRFLNEMDEEEKVKTYFSLSHIYFSGVRESIQSGNSEYQKLIGEKLLDYDSLEVQLAYLEDHKMIEVMSHKLKVGFVNPSIYSNLILNFNNYIYALKTGQPYDLDQKFPASFFVAKYLDMAFVMLVFLSTVIVFDSIYKDVNSGVIKTIMSSPMRRMRYFIIKVLSAYSSMMIVLFVPILICALVLTMIDGYTAWNYPIHISKYTLSSFTPHKQYSYIVNKYILASDFSTFKNVCNFGPITQFTTDRYGIGYGGALVCSPDVIGFQSITVGHYISLLVSYLLLIFMLMASLNTLLSLKFKTALLNLIALVGILGVSLILTDLFIGQKFLEFLPFTFMNPIKLLMNLTPYTFIHGVLMVSIWIVGIIGAIGLILKRHDFLN